VRISFLAVIVLGLEGKFGDEAHIRVRGRPLMQEKNLWENVVVVESIRGGMEEYAVSHHRCA